MVQLGQQLIRNILSSWGGYVVRLIITFFFVPYIASVFGDARYGVWVIIFQTINYFSLLDIGLTSALTRFVSKHLSAKDFPRISQVLSTSSALYLVVGSIVFGGVYLFVSLFFDHFKIGDPSLIEEGKNALLILGAFMSFNFLLLPYGNSLVAFQRHDVTRILATGEELVRVVVMVWLIANGYGLESLAVVILLVSVVKHLAGVYWLKRLYPQVSFSPHMIEGQTARTLLGYSRVSFGITIGWLVMFNTDTFLLGLLSSSAAAGVYNPGTQLMLYLRNIVNSIGTPLIPAISHVEATGEQERISSIYLRGVKYVAYLSVLLTVGVVIYARSFVALWLPPEFSRAADVMIILAFGSAVFLPQIIGNSVLFGVGQHRYILWTLAWESLIKIVLSLVLIPAYGLIGMAFANTVPQICLYLTLYPVFMGRVLKISPWRILVWKGRSMILALCVTLPTALLVRYVLPPASWAALGVNILLVVLAALIPGYFILEPDDRRKIISFFRKNE